MMKFAYTFTDEYGRRQCCSTQDEADVLKWLQEKTLHPDRHRIWGATYVRIS